MAKKKTPARRRAGAGEIAARRRAGSMQKAAPLLAIVANAVGALALLAAIAGIGWLLLYTGGDNSISSAFPDDVGGTRTIAAPALLLLLSMVAFFFGQYAARGRWGVGDDSPSSTGRFRVDLRPIGAGLHVILLAAAVVAWMLVLVVPVILDARGDLVLSDGGSAADQFWFVVIVYGVISAATAMMIAVSLLKKLTYNRSLARHAAAIRPGSSSQRLWRQWSHIWRGELGVAAFGGIALGLSPLGAPLGSAAFTLGMLAAGVVLTAFAVVLALNAWRSGLPVERVESA